MGKKFTDSVPWFPRKMTDLDTFAEKVLEMGEELSRCLLQSTESQQQLFLQSSS